jgi:hypothetical protein
VIGNFEKRRLRGKGVDWSIILKIILEKFNV